MKVKFSLLKHQKEFIKSDAKFTCMLCGRGSGKTYVASLLCALSLVQQKRLIIFAQTADALRENLMTEIRMRLDEIIPGKYKYNQNTSKITYKQGVIYGFSYENIEAVRGYTAIELAIFDEIARAPQNLLNVATFCLRGKDKDGNDIKPKIYCMTTPRMGSWFNRYVKEHSEIKLIRATMYDNKFCTEDQIALMKATVIDENMLKQELLGEIVEDESAGVLFSSRLLDTAYEYCVNSSDNTYCIGIDCSGLGRDMNAIVLRTKTEIKEILKFNKITNEDLTRRVKMLIEHYDIKNLSHVCIDEAYGLDLYERLTNEIGQQYLTLVPFAGSSPEPGYANNRAYMYCKLKKAIEENGLKGLTTDIKDELGATRYILNNSNKIQIIPKDDIKLNIGRSPDVSDALALSFYNDLFKKSLVSERKERQKRYLD